MLGLTGFEQNSAEDVRAELLAKGSIESAFSNALGDVSINAGVTTGLVRIGEVPLYQADAICRRAPSLQKTADAAAPVATAHSSLLASLNVAAGSQALLRQGNGELKVQVEADDSLPADTVRLATAHPLTAGLGGMFDSIALSHG